MIAQIVDLACIHQGIQYLQECHVWKIWPEKRAWQLSGTHCGNGQISGVLSSMNITSCSTPGQPHFSSTTSSFTGLSRTKDTKFEICNSFNAPNGCFRHVNLYVRSSCRSDQHSAVAYMQRQRQTSKAGAKASAAKEPQRPRSRPPPKQRLKKIDLNQISGHKRQSWTFKI